MQINIPVPQEHSTISLGNKVSHLVKSAHRVCTARDLETHGQLDTVVQGGTAVEMLPVTRQLFMEACVNQDITVMQDRLTQESVMEANFVMCPNWRVLLVIARLDTTAARNHDLQVQQMEQQEMNALKAISALKVPEIRLLALQENTMMPFKQLIQVHASLVRGGCTVMVLRLKNQRVTVLLDGTVLPAKYRGLQLRIRVQLVHTAKRA